MKGRSVKTPRLNKEELEVWKEKMKKEKDPEKRAEIQKENPRATYIEYDESTGRIACIFDPEKDKTLLCSVEAKYAIAEEMHRMDDRQVDHDSRKSQLPEGHKAELKEKYIREFYAETGRAPIASEIPSLQFRVKSYDAIMDADPADPECDAHNLADKHFITNMSMMQPYDCPDSAASFMNDLVIYSDEFTQDEKNLYKLVYINMKQKGEAAAILGLSKGRISKMINTIQEKLRNNPALRRYFRFA